MNGIVRKQYLFLTWLIFMALMIVDPARTYAQEEEVVEEQAEVLTPVQRRLKQEISIDFRETPIEDVLRVLAKQADIDVVKSPKVIGDVTATLTNIPLDEALNNILSAHGFGYVSTANMIRVVPKSEIIEEQTQERFISRVYRITYADAIEVAKALKDYVTPQIGSISVNPGTSNIMITDTESKIKAIDAFIEEIDRITPQVLVEARIYDISAEDSLDLGIEWTAGRNINYGNGGLSGLGTNSTLTSTGQKTDPHIGSAFSSEINQATTTAGLLRFGFLNRHINIDALISAEQSNVSAKLLASPKLMVLDNEVASIKIVEEIPYQELTETSAGGAIGTTKFKDIGVELHVTPHIILKDEMIRMVINPKFSVRTGDSIGGQPVVATREETTTILIKDQQTVIIGGLKKQTVNNQISKVPLLGDIPLLGELFKFTGDKIVNSELVVFITPKISLEQSLTAHEKVLLSETEIPAPILIPGRLEIDGLK